jgi:FixJ family two-component response regulator
MSAIHQLPARGVTALSSHERDVVEFGVAGNADHVIAWHLGISPSAVETHRASAMAKLGVGTIAELVPLTLARWNDAGV